MGFIKHFRCESCDDFPCTCGRYPDYSRTGLPAVLLSAAQSSTRCFSVSFSLQELNMPPRRSSSDTITLNLEELEPEDPPKSTLESQLDELPTTALIRLSEMIETIIDNRPAEHNPRPGVVIREVPEQL